MGSTNTRKKNDRVRINTPQSVSGSGTGGAAGGRRDINAVCPMAFDVLIKPRVTIPDGTEITVHVLKLLVFGKEVGQLPRRNFITLVECGKEGITYSAHVVNRPEGKTYARFEQRA